MLGLNVTWLPRIFVIVTVISAAIGRTTGAVDSTLYFAAIVGPASSISNEGSATTSVYLRWDEIEGRLPSEVMTLRILRNDIQVAEFPASSLMEEAEIDALYAPTVHGRRRAETIHWLSMMSGDSITPSNFGATLRQNLESDRIWAHLAARNDVLIAAVRRRAWIDTASPAGIVTYELVGVTSSGTMRRLGYAAIDTTVLTVLPAPANLMQVLTGRCDAAEAARDHGAIALNWSHPGRSGTERFHVATLTTGFDLYRTAVSLNEPVNVLPRDLRAEGLDLAHDANGNVEFPGLVKVNDQPLVVTGGAASENHGPGFQRAFAQHFETTEEVAAAGFSPGDHVAYYVVARDITGNYGATSAVSVTIPNLVGPPAPWEVRTYTTTGTATTGSDVFRLVWDTVDVANYYRNFQTNRTYCNLDTARFDRRLDYVMSNESCAVKQPIPVPLDVDRYLVYRFENVAAAKRFSDTDGDGWSDLIERIDAEAPDLTLPGTACDPTAGPASTNGVENYKIAEIAGTSAIARPNGRNVIEFVDPMPAQNKSDIYWYRVAAVATSGVVGELSVPTRGLFHDRTRPARGEITDFTFGPPMCKYTSSLIQPADANRPYAIDATTYGWAEAVEVGCQRDFVTPLRIRLNIVNGIRARGASMPDGTCATLVNLCSGNASSYATFLGADGKALDPNDPASVTVAYPEGFNSCVIENAQLEDTCQPGAITPMPGEPLPAPPVLDFPNGAPGCISIYRELNGRAFRWRTVCPGDPNNFPLTLDGPSGGDVACYSIALHNENALVSTKLRLPCFRVPNQVLDALPPQLLGLTFDPGSSDGFLAWKPPAQSIIGTILEWRRMGG